MKRSALSAGLLITVVGALYTPSAFAWNFNHPTYSSPIVISADNKLVWSVNPADNSVSVVRTDTNKLDASINGCVRLIGRLIGFDVGFYLRKGAWATFFAASGGVEGAMPRRCVSGTAIV